MDASTNSSKLIATTEVRIFGATSYLILSTISVFMNLFLLLLLIRGRKEYIKHAFYIIVGQQVICDLMALSIEYIIVIPITYANYNIFGSTLTINIIGYFDTLGYYGTAHFAVLMTINRITAFIFPKINSLLFGPSTTLWTIAAVWSYAIFLSLGNNFIAHCVKNFSIDGYYLYHDCAPNRTEFAVDFETYQGFCFDYFPVAMLIAYFLLYVDLKITMRGSLVASSSSKKRDYALLLQCFIICAMLEIENLQFKFIPMLPVSGQWKFIVNFMQNLLALFNEASNATVLFIFNSEIRRSLSSLLKAFRNKTQASTKMFTINNR